MLLQQPCATIYTVSPVAFCVLVCSSIPCDEYTLQKQEARTQLGGRQCPILVEKAQLLLLAHCLLHLNEIDGPYFYEAIGSVIIPGSLSYLLCITNEHLMTIYM
jgi:hypothetical protein